MRIARIVPVAVLLALSLALAFTSSAEEVRGTGTTWAKGAGLAILRGYGEILTRHGDQRAQ